MNAPTLCGDRPLAVNGPPEHVNGAAEHGFAHGHGNTAARRGYAFAAKQAIRGVKRDAAHVGGGSMRCNFHMNAAFRDQKLVDLGKAVLETHIQNRPRDADDGSFILHGVNPLLSHLRRRKP